MSERTTLKSLDAPVEQESSELSSLRASKDLGSKPANLDCDSTPATDLSLNSITTSGVERISARPDKRIIRHGHGVALSPEAKMDKSHSAKSSTKSEVGIFKNPYYPYQGNLADRFIALLANICKVLERLFLKLLSGGDAPLPKPSQRQPEPTASQPSPTEAAAKKREATQKQQRELRTHRS